MSSSLTPPFLSDEGRKLNWSEWRALAAERFGVEVVQGLIEVVEDHRCQKQVGYVTSFRYFPRAWRVSHASGSESVLWRTGVVQADWNAPYVAFIFPMAMGYGSTLPQPSGQFVISLDDKPCVTFRDVKYTERWEENGAVFCYCVKRTEIVPEGQVLYLDEWIQGERMASFGVGVLLVPRSWVRPGQPSLIRVTSTAREPSKRWFRVDGGLRTEGDFPGITLYNWWDALETAVRPRRLLEIDGRKVAFGEVHAHTGVNSDGEETIDEVWRRAKTAGNVDFFALTDHDDAMNADTWRWRVEAANRYDEPGRFVGLLAYEYTNFMYGHRNLYFRGDDAPFFSCRDPRAEYNFGHPRELYAFLREHNAEVVSVPHHPLVADHPFNWNLVDPEYDRLVEIFSGWGNHEDVGVPLRGLGSDKWSNLSVKAALARGLRLGFIASSDSHDGHPGYAQGKLKINWFNKNTQAGSGRAAVMVDRLDRESIWQGLYRRSCYATTGARILLSFSVNGASMGEEITAGKERKIALRVEAPCPVAKIHIVRNGETIAREWCDQPVETLELADRRSEGGVDYYYARITLADGEMAWSSPVWVEPR